MESDDDWGGDDDDGADGDPDWDWKMDLNGNVLAIYLKEDKIRFFFKIIP